MNWSWTELLAFLGCLGLAWKISQQVIKTLKAQTEAIRQSATAQVESALAQEEARKKAAADKERTQELWNLVEIHSELIEGIHDHLALPPEVRERREFFIRKATRNLEKKGFDRLENYHTDFT